MRKVINDYKLYVFDLDGTLYDQPDLRRIMALRLMSYYVFRPLKIKELILLSHFRKVKDGWKGSSSEEEIIKKTASDKGADPAVVSAVVKKWIYDNPISALRRTADKALIEWIASLRKRGRKVAVLSDYPAALKLEALSVKVDGIYDPTDERIDELKPSPKGLISIMNDFGVQCGDVLMIGDRMEKDGECAKAAGCDWLILPRKINKRHIDEIKH